MSPTDVRQNFAEYDFGAPRTVGQLARAESMLSDAIPDLLRDLYLAFDGFNGPTGAAFLWPLFAKQPGSVGLVEMNLFLRGGDEFPADVVSQCLFYGDPGIGPYWGLKRDLPGKVVLWDAEWGQDFEIVGDDLLEVWLDAKREYDDLDTA